MNDMTDEELIKAGTAHADQASAPLAHIIRALVARVEADQWRPIDDDAKDGYPVILLIDGDMIEGYWYAAPGPNQLNDGHWLTISLSSHGCGCCGESDPPPTHYRRITLPDGGA